MTSKASKWAAVHKARPVFTLPSVNGIVGPRWQVNDDGHCEIGSSKLTLTPAQALALAQGILDIFSEGVER